MIAWYPHVEVFREANMTSPSQRQRYAKESSQSTWSGKMVAIFAVVIFIAFIVAGVKYVNSQVNKTISAKTATVEQVSGTIMRQWLDVTRKHTDRVSYCIVKAVDYDKNEVGRREVIIPAGGDKVQRIEVDITTTVPAASADVYGCSEDLPFYLSVPS